MKIKTWLKNHKKEIIVGAMAAGGTTLFFLMKERNIKGIKCCLKLNLGFLKDLEDDDGYYGLHKRNDAYTNINVHKPGLKISDMGKLGDELLRCIPSLTKDAELNHLNANYNIGL